MKRVVYIFFFGKNGEKRENGTNGREEGVRKKGDPRFLFLKIDVFQLKKQSKVALQPLILWRLVLKNSLFL
jgi:hypothetical protein